MKKLLLIASYSLLFCACNNNGGSSNNSQSLNYDLAENGCSTGSHTFASASDLCYALEDNALNNNCAMSLREQEFQNNCPNQTFNPF